MCYKRNMTQIAQLPRFNGRNIGDAEAQNFFC